MKIAFFAVVAALGAAATPCWAAATTLVRMRITNNAVVGPFGQTKQYFDEYGDSKLSMTADSLSLTKDLSGSIDGSFNAFVAATNTKYTYDAASSIAHSAFTQADVLETRIVADGAMLTVTTPTNNSDPSLPRGASGETTDAITAGWGDSWYFDKPGAPAGKSYTIHGKMFLDGKFDVSLDNPGNATFGLKLDATGLGTSPYGVYWAYFQEDAADHSFDHNEEPPNVVPITTTIQNGAFESVYFNMTLSGDVSIGGDSGGSYHADFSHTLRWGGIDSVTDDDTGLPVTGWTLTADSGADYYHAVPVPEPLAAPVGAVAGVWALLRRRRRRGVGGAFLAE
jgi:hypothetical protein